jgi:small subunit ribosomal protein S11
MAKAEAQGGDKSPKKKKTFKKRGEKRVVHHGFVHIQASFNNTLITITDAEGAVVSWSSAGAIGFKGSRKGTPFAATQAALTATNAAKTFGMRSCEGAGIRPRVGDPCAVHRRARSEVDSRRHPDPAQRLPSPEASSRLVEEKNGSIQRTGLQALPPRRHEALSEGRALLHGKVRN